MTRRRIYFPAISALLLTLALPYMFSGCSDDSTAPEGPAAADFSGIWDLTIETVEKQLCFGEIGDINQSELPIAQNGNQATILIDNVISVPLTVNGANATGSTDIAGLGSISVALTLAGSEMSGTMTLTQTREECTQVYDMSGTRANAAPSSGFAGNWDLGVMVTDSRCDGETEGETANLCRSITVDNNTVTLHEPDGVLTGVGDGDTAYLWRIDDDERLSVTLTLDGEAGLTGDAYTWDQVDQCSVTHSIEGARRREPCPPPPTTDDFAGPWLVHVTQFSQTGCIGESEEDYFASCMSIVVGGSTISADDGSGRGFLSGSFDGETATLTRTEPNGVYTLHLQLVGDDLYGEAVMNYTSGECTGTVVEISIEGSRLSSPCGSGSTGAFAGYWNNSGQFTSNDCEFSISPYCDEFVQDGDTVYIVGEGLEGTVSGNILTINFQDGPFTLEYVIVLAPGGNSYEGTLTLTMQDLQNPEISCTSVADMTGTRTTGCDPVAADFGISSLGKR